MSLPTTDRTKLNNLSPNLVPQQIAVSALRLAVFQEIYTYLDNIITDLNAAQATGAVTTAKLADGGVSTVKLADNAVTGAKLLDAAVIAAKLADGSVTTQKVGDGAVVTIKLADGAVVSAKIADLNITSGKIADNAIVTVKLADGAVLSAKIADGAVTSLKMADGGVTGAKIADNTITTQKLVDSIITAAKILDGSVTNAKLAPGSVTGDKVANGAINSQHMDAALLASAASLSVQAEFDKRGVSVQKYGAKGDGIASDSSALSAAITALQVSGGEIVFPSGTYRLTANVSVPANVTLRFMTAAKLSIDSGVTVTINGGINAGLYPIFSGSGTVTGDAQVREVYVQWFGGKGDGNSDDTQAMEAAISFAKTNGKNLLLKGIFKILKSSKIVVLAPFAIQGEKGSPAEVRFSHKDGGFYFGDDVVETNELHLTDIKINGMRACDTPVTISNIQNIYFSGVHVGGSMSYLMDIRNNGGILFWDNGVLDGDMNTQGGASWQRIQKGIRLDTVNNAVFRGVNIWTLSSVFDIYNGIGNLVVDSCWLEANKDVFTTYTPTTDPAKPKYTLNIKSSNNQYYGNTWGAGNYAFSLFKVLTADEASANLGGFITSSFNTINDTFIFNSGVSFENDCLCNLQNYAGTIVFNVSNIAYMFYSGNAPLATYRFLKITDAMQSNANIKVVFVNYTTLSWDIQADKAANFTIQNIIEQGRKNFAAVTIPQIKLCSENPDTLQGTIAYYTFNKSLNMYRTATEVINVINLRKGTVTPVGNVTGDFAGQMYENTATQEFFICTVNGDLNGWKKITLS